MIALSPIAKAKQGSDVAMESRLQARVRMRYLRRMKYSSSKAKAQRKQKRMQQVRFEVGSKARIRRHSGLPLCGMSKCRIPACNIPRCGLLNCKLPECILPELDLAEYLLPSCGLARCRLPQCQLPSFPCPWKQRLRASKRSDAKLKLALIRSKQKQGVAKATSSRAVRSRRKSARLVAKKLRTSARLVEKRRRKRGGDAGWAWAWAREWERERERDGEQEQEQRFRKSMKKRRKRRKDQQQEQEDVVCEEGQEDADTASAPAQVCTSCKLCKRSSSSTAAGVAKSVVQRLTDLGEENLLLLVLEKLPPGTLLQASRVCRSWARQCEIVFKRECQHNGWSLPRHPRWSTTAFPWRSLYFRHACRVCGRIGEFFVRKRLNGNFQFLLCGTCIRLPSVKERLVQYSIDLYGVSGKLVVRSLSMSRSRKIQSFV